MDFSKEIIDKIYEHAKNLTPPADIAALLDIPEDLLELELSCKTSPARRAYRKGKAETALMLRTQQLELASVGSPVAVQLSSLYLREMSTESDF